MDLSKNSNVRYSINNRGNKMTCTGTLNELIKGNTQDFVEDYQDIKSTIEMLNQGAQKALEEKENSIYKKIKDWECDDNVNDLASWFNELRELVGNDNVEIPDLCGDCFQMDLYHRLETILPLITCNMDSDVLYRNEDGIFVVENLDSLFKRYLTGDDKREVAHLIVDKMEDAQLNEVLKMLV
jgi:hypothetical protein